MSCAHGCDDGWIDVVREDGVHASRACECRPRQLAGFRPGYAPGGRNISAKARDNGRKGGLASGVKRRQLREQRRRTGDGGLGVKRAYFVPRRSTAEIRVAFDALNEAEGVRHHEHGWQTFLASAQIMRNWYDVKGQGFEMTSGNLMEALAKRGISCCRRTAQYTVRRLKRAGLLQHHHIKRSGALRIPGQMDTIRIVLLRSRRPCPRKRLHTAPTGHSQPVRSDRSVGCRPAETTESPPAKPPADKQKPPAGHKPAEGQKGTTAMKTSVTDGGAELSTVDARLAEIDDEICFQELKALKVPRWAERARARKAALCAERRALTDPPRDRRSALERGERALPGSRRPAPGDRGNASSFAAESGRADRGSPPTADPPSAVRTPSYAAAREGAPAFRSLPEQRDA